ncbi:hypothetical protein VNO77_21389 [Canavalia gladiata]|uniref:Protein kinase domain-containing protein n=1 Tax=Canavalia gladiata TaxID=3824 RepID=A0AAN9LRA3_CANGL
MFLVSEKSLSKQVSQIGIMFLKYFGFRSSKHTNSSQRQYPTVIEELCHHFSPADLRKLTNNFAKDRVIGKGAFSTAYKGYIQNNDASDYTVVIKRWRKESRGQRQMWKNEIELLCQLRHPNLVSLVGFCEIEMSSVYEYMSNGSLDQHLRGGVREALSWKKRLEICIGAARGLHYLHAGAKRTILHRDIKPSNILLDDAMEPKLAGFSLVLQGQHFRSKPKPIQVDVAGTMYYIAVEYFRDQTITDKCDVYSFGMVLLQVVSGMKYLNMLTDRLSGESPAPVKPVEEIIDSNIKGKIAPECWEVFMDVTQRCLNHEPDERPTMGEVEVQLEHALSLQEQADIKKDSGDFILSSTTIINPYESI